LPGDADIIHKKYVVGVAGREGTDVRLQSIQVVPIASIVHNPHTRCGVSDEAAAAIAINHIVDDQRRRGCRARLVDIYGDPVAVGGS